MNTRVAIPDDMTVNDVIRRWPETVAIFNRFGIDACCGGTVPLREAALRDGADPDELLEQVARVVAAAEAP